MGIVMGKYTKETIEALRQCWSIAGRRDWEGICREINKIKKKYPRCHEEAEVLSRLVPGAVRKDGYFKGHEHSWVELSEGIIFDSALDHLGAIEPLQASRRCSTLWHSYHEVEMPKRCLPNQKIVRFMLQRLKKPILQKWTDPEV